MRHFLVLLALFLSIPVFAARPERDVLTESLAQARKAVISNVAYELEFEFTAKAETYAGRTTIDFDLSDISQPVSLDSMISNILSVEVNGIAIIDFTKQEGSFEIPARYLAAHNHLVIRYENDFSDSGSGLTHFTDPADGREYIYSDSEPYGAHKIFPGFDQPNLKATYLVTITAPKGWIATANEVEASSQELGDSVVHRFAPSKPFSTYLMFIAAGHFHEWKTEWRGRPVVLFARESLAQFVDADVIFGVTKTGLDFYSDYFGYTYPFSKYGQVFCPDMGPGAMENPGSVSINERMIYRGPQTRGVLEGRANTILHEMAHMWFGDLVTMNWWSDLWLNESFATFMATLAQEKAFGLGERAWQSFNQDKGWAYWQDQMVTTHPIVTEVSDTDVASTNFDGITYGKGAATLKQLHFYVGDDNFRRGVQAYFQKYQWSNTTRADFIGEIANAAGMSLDDWSQGWLESAGLNQVQVKFSCDAGKVMSLALEQQPTVAGKYLPHKTKIALYRRAGQGLEKFAEFAALYRGASTNLEAARGFDCPDFVEANAGDEDYVITKLDPKSLEQVGLLPSIDSSLERQMLWGTLFQMVRHAELKLNDYFVFLTKNLPLETDEETLEYLVGKYSNASELYWGVLTVAERAALAPALERNALAKLAAATPGSSTYYLWLDHYLEIADSTGAPAELRSLLPSLDQSRRWKAIKRLAAKGTPGALELAKGEADHDKSSQGRNEAFAANVAWPELASKQKAWSQITDLSSGLSFAERRAGGEAFHSLDHPEISAEFVKPFFTMVKGFKWDGQMFLAARMFQGLFPKLCTAELLSESNAQLQGSRANLPKIAVRAWLEANDELEHCVQMRAFNR